MNLTENFNYIDLTNQTKVLTGILRKLNKLLLLVLSHKQNKYFSQKEFRILPLHQTKTPHKDNISLSKALK